MQKFSIFKSATFRKLKRFTQDAVEAACDNVVALLPQAQPSLDAIRQVRIIAHRGAHLTVPENTLEAFDIAAHGRVDGIEFDVRSTVDGVLVICHDQTARRVFKKRIRISKTNFARVRSVVPRIPTLSEVVNRYHSENQIQGPNAPGLHLMIELKGIKPKKKHGWTPQRLQQLAHDLQSLSPITDYHLMSLNPRALMAAQKSGHFPPKALLSIATTNTSRISHATLGRDWGGITGHFILLSKSIQQLHFKRGQKVGVGFVQSANSFRRQIHRGADWVFSNDAVKLAKLRQAWLAAGSTKGPDPK